MARSDSPEHPVARIASDRGPVMIIGGAEDKLRDRVILSRFVSMAGGPDAHIVVISTASSLGDLATDGFSAQIQAPTFVHVDIDARQIGRSYAPTHAVVACAPSVVVLNAWNSRLGVLHSLLVPVAEQTGEGSVHVGPQGSEATAQDAPPW